MALVSESLRRDGVTLATVERLERRGWTAHGAVQRALLAGRWQALSSVMVAGGPALLATFLFLGRPPLSVPTLHGIAFFASLVAIIGMAWRCETGLVMACAPRTWRWVLAGYAPLTLAWFAAGLLYVPAVYHWYVYVPSVRPALIGAVLVPAAAWKLALTAALLRERLVAWCWRWRYALSGALYAGVALAAKPGQWHGDLPAWFVPAARLLLAGHPLAIYTVRADVLGVASPIEHGPLTILFYAPFVALADAAGVHDFMRLAALFPLAGVLVADCLMAYQVTRAIRDLAPRTSEEHLFGVYALVLFSPLLWFASVWLVHLESVAALLIVGAARLLSRDRGWLSGALLGCALLVKHSLALAAAPMLVALLVGGAARQRRVALVAGGMAGAVGAAGLLPFALATPRDFAFNFIEYDAIKPIYGVTIWKALYDSGLERLAMQLDSVVIGFLALAAAVGVGVAARRQRGATNASVPMSACWAAVFLGQLAWLGLTTWQYPHYFVLAFVALLIWESAELARRSASGTAAAWPVLALAVLCLPYNLQAHLPGNVGKAGGPFVVSRAVAQVLLLYGLAVASWLRLGGPCGAQRADAGAALVNQAM